MYMNKNFLVFLLVCSLYNYSPINSGVALSKVKNVPYAVTKKILTLPKDILTNIMNAELNISKKTIMFGLLILFLAQMNNYDSYEEMPPEFLERNFPDFLNNQCQEVITTGYIYCNGQHITIEDIKIIVCNFSNSNTTLPTEIFA